MRAGGDAQGNGSNDSASPAQVSHPLRLIKRYNHTDPAVQILEYFGKELIPDWLFPKEGEKELDTLHTKFYKDAIPENDEPLIWCPIRFEGGQPEKYGIYYTVANRIDYLERLLRQPNISSEITHAILEVQDRYQMLTLHMEMTGSYTNESLTQVKPGKCSIAPLYMFYPDKDKAFTLDCLRDMFIPLLYCKFWGDNIDIPYTDPELIKLIGVFAKGLPSPCKGRSVTTILPDTWDSETTSSPVFDTIIRVIMASLLGVYEHADRVCFQVRRRVYKWFAMSMPDKETVSRWIKMNKHLIIYIMRENIFKQIEGLPAVNDYMNDNYYWYYMTKNTHEAMNCVRQHVNKTILTYTQNYPINNQWDIPDYQKFLTESCYFADIHLEKYLNVSAAEQWKPGTSWFAGLDVVLAGFNKSNLDYCHRPLEMSFLDSVVASIKDIDDAHYNDNDYMLDENDSFTPDHEVMMKRLILEGFRTDEPLSYEWLVPYFKVSVVSVLKLLEAEKLYVRETSRSKVSTTLKKMALKNYRDYYILKTFFLTLKKKYSFMLYDLPYHIMKQQIEAFHEMYGTVNGEMLHQSAGVYYMCPNCGELKAKVVPSNQPHRSAKERECTLSFERVSIDMVTRKLYCSKPASKSTPKKRTVTTDVVSEAMELDIDKKKETKKQSKENRRKTIMELCPKTELIKVNMIGKLAYTEKWGCIFLCPKCRCLTTFGRSAYTDSHGELSCGCARNLEATDNALNDKKKCGVCDKPSDIVVSHMVYDDVSNPDKPEIRIVPFCSAHDMSWIRKWKTIKKLSEVRSAVKQHWTSVEIDGGTDRIFIANKRTETAAQANERRKLINEEDPEVDV